jgi:phytoene dehydrogenase-like protein
MSSEKRVVVIGSGVGGAGIGVLLAHKGFEVMLLEKNAFTGGKATSFERDGFIYDFGVHYSARGERGPLGDITRIIGGDLRFLNPSPYARLQLHITMSSWCMVAC